MKLSALKLKLIGYNDKILIKIIDWTLQLISGASSEVQIEKPVGKEVSSKETA